MEKLKQELTNYRYVNGTLLTKEGIDRSFLSVSSPYRRMSIAGKTHLVHRLIFFYFNGFFPKVVDHIDGNPLNNKIENLQGCTQSINLEKAKIFRTNKTGFKGVSLRKDCNKYESYYTKDYVRVHCGLYNTAEEAFKAREEHKYGNN